MPYNFLIGEPPKLFINPNPVMPTNNDLLNGDRRQDNNDPLKKWYTKKEAMKFFDVGKTLFNDYTKLYGLKACGIGNKKQFHIDDMNDFLLRHRH